MERVVSRFPFADRPKLWGVAVSHYQVEGGDVCDWTEWERSGRTRGGPCGEATGGWERYEDDVDLAVAAGANAFRFSISWSRVEPRRGEFDESALLRYGKLVEHCLSRGVEPVVTLFHYTHPAWFHVDTPWTTPESVKVFARFADKVFSALGPAVRMYTILNEPLVFLLAGYVDGQAPPGLTDTRAAGLALEHLLRAHAETAALLREKQPAAAIGVAHNMMAFAPERSHSLLDRLLATTAHRFYNERIWEAFATGRWNFLLPPFTRFRGRCEELVGSLDFVGVNFYSRLHLRSPGKRRWIGDFYYTDRSGLGMTDNGWEIVPHLLQSMLGHASVLGLPIVVTENGIADASDEKRARFLVDHLEAIERARQQGIPVEGYFYWSLVDNFEWLEGFGPRFGLYAVNPPDMTRVPRRSIETFRELGKQFLGVGG